MFRRMLHELKEHSPFTLFGAMIGVILMLVFKNISRETAFNVFYVFHPLHVFLSAIVTSVLYKVYKERISPHGVKFYEIIIIGVLGSIGVGTLSDSLIPFWGEKLLDMHNAEIHAGFLEKWWLIFPAAMLGVLVSYFKPNTKFSHAGHVLISTSASLFHMLMAHDHGSGVSYFGIFIFLFLAVWLPCCLSDIIFPLLFVRDEKH